MKKILSLIALFFGNLIGDVEAFIKNNVTPAKTVLELLKSIVDSGAANILVALTPSDKDDKVRLIVSTLLGKAIDALYLNFDINNEQDWTNKLVKTIDYARSLSEPMRGKFYAALEAELVKQSASDTGIKNHVVDTILQMLYSAEKMPTMADALQESGNAIPVVQVAIKAPKAKKVKAVK